jgi:hypothetical protein
MEFRATRNIQKLQRAARFHLMIFLLWEEDQGTSYGSSKNHDL